MNNNNNNDIKSTFSNIRPSDECIERIMNMTNESKSRRIGFKPIAAIAACLIIAITGVIGGNNLINKKENAYVGPTTSDNVIDSENNIFTLTAYAYDGENKTATVLNDDKVTVQNYKLWRQYGSDGILELHGHGESGFAVSGKNISSVKYKCKTGNISFGIDFNKLEYLKEQGKYYDVILPYLEEYKNIENSEKRQIFEKNFTQGNYDKYFENVEKRDISEYYNIDFIYNDDDSEIIGIGVVSNEAYKIVSDEGGLKEYTFKNYLKSTEDFAEIYWECDGKEKEKLLQDENMGYDELPHDTLSVTVTFDDGSVQTAKYDLSFNKDGNLVVEKL